MTAPVTSPTREVVVAVRCNRRVEMLADIAGLAGRTLFGVVQPVEFDQLDEVAHEEIGGVRRDGGCGLGRVPRVGQLVDELPRTLGRTLHV